MGEENIGLFVAAYEIGTGPMGAPLLHLRIAVATPERTVTGACDITQATTPGSPRFAATVGGTFTYLGLMPPSPTFVVVHAIGYPLGTPPQSTLAPTFELDMLLDETWAGGVANFRYESTRIDGAKVRLVTPATVADIGPAEITLDQPAGSRV